jgi:hypothetical protein
LSRARESLAQGPRHALVDQLAADVKQAPVLHARRARGFAVQARQAAVQVQLGLAGRLGAFEHILDQVDAPARAIEFVAQQLVRRAGGGAEAAVHAGSQDRLGLAALARALDEIGQSGLHVLCAL